MNELKKIVVENYSTKEIKNFKSIEELKKYFKNNLIIAKFLLDNEIKIQNLKENSYNCFYIENWQLSFLVKRKSSKKKGNNQGSIYFDNTKQCWAGQYTYNGKRKPPVHQKKGETKTEFISRFNEILASISNGSYLEKSKDTLYIVL